MAKHNTLETLLALKEYTIKSLLIALHESVKLQSHYAELLNMHDGGERIVFQSAKSWIERLREIGKIEKERD